MNPFCQHFLMLSRLAICIASIAFGLLRDLILDDPSDHVRSLLTRFDLSFGRNISYRLKLGRFCVDAILSLTQRLLPFLEPYQVSLRAPVIPGRCYCQAFCLPCKPGRIGRVHLGTIVTKQSIPCIGCSREAV